MELGVGGVNSVRTMVGLDISYLAKSWGKDSTIIGYYISSSYDGSYRKVTFGLAPVVKLEQRCGNIKRFW